MNSQPLHIDVVTRRAAISIGGASAAALALAACSPLGPEFGTAPPAEGAIPATEPTEVMKLSQIPVGGSATAKLGQIPIILEQPTRGSVIGFSAVCTHQGCTVAAVMAVNQFQCPCHGSVYDASTGAVIHGPTQLPLRKLRIVIQGDSVLASLA